MRSVEKELKMIERREKRHGIFAGISYLIGRALSTLFWTTIIPEQELAAKAMKKVAEEEFNEDITNRVRSARNKLVIKRQISFFTGVAELLSDGGTRLILLIFTLAGVGLPRLFYDELEAVGIHMPSTLTILIVVWIIINAAVNFLANHYMYHALYLCAIALRAMKPDGFTIEELFYYLRHVNLEQSNVVGDFDLAEFELRLW